MIVGQSSLKGSHASEFEIKSAAHFSRADSIQLDSGPNRTEASCTSKILYRLRWVEVEGEDVRK